jgi:hypothetical protein
MCGKQLCYLKAWLSRFVPVRDDIHAMLKLDVPLVKRRHARRLDSNFVEMTGTKDDSTLEYVN